MIFQVHFSDSITLGSIILVCMVGAAIAYFRIRAGVADVWQDVAKGHEERADLAETRLHESQQQLQDSIAVVGEQKEIIERLKALPNLSAVITSMTDQFKEIERVRAEQFDTTDKRADARFREALALVTSHDEHLAHVEEMMDTLSAAHEERAQERHDEQMSVMREMAETQHEMAETFRKIGNGQT